MNEASVAYVYGFPPPDLVETPPGAVQLSPLTPGAAVLEDFAPGEAGRFMLAAPAGTLERRFVLALALAALREGGELIAVAPKEKGGSRLGAELRAFGCDVEEVGRRHHRLCRTKRPAEPKGLEAAIVAGAPRIVEAVAGWTQPGVFSWDRPDPGTDLLIRTLPALKGAGADLGCGVGRLAQAVLASAAVSRIDLFDIDRRAVEAARRNVVDPRATAHWADVCETEPAGGLDFVVMNPPFHEGGARTENRSLGQDFIRVAHRILRPGGWLWMVGNRHLPYEGVLAPLFSSVETKAEAQGFKVIAARR